MSFSLTLIKTGCLSALWMNAEKIKCEQEWNTGEFVEGEKSVARVTGAPCPARTGFFSSSPCVRCASAPLLECSAGGAGHDRCLEPDTRHRAGLWGRKCSVDPLLHVFISASNSVQSLDSGTTNQSLKMLL